MHCRLLEIDGLGSARCLCVMQNEMQYLLDKSFIVVYYSLHYDHINLFRQEVKYRLVHFE